MGWGRRLSACALLLVLMTILSSCSRDTPLCDYARDLAKSADLGPAADAYATAQQSGEGDCAEDGIVEISERQATARAHVAKGRAAARAGDTAAARTLFRAALKIDRGDALAATELQRLGQPAPNPTPMVSPIVVVAPTTRNADGGGLAWLVLAIVALAVLANAALWLSARRRTNAADTARQHMATTLATLQSQLNAFDTRLTELTIGLDQDTSKTKDQVADLARTIDGFPSRILGVIRASLTLLAGREAPHLDEHYVRKHPEEP